MNKITLTINGQEIQTEPGKTILEVVTEQELDEIPTLCHSPELKPYGSCFICVVEVEGRPNLVPSCATKVAPGMKVTTRNDRVVASRKTALELLLSNHYADCISPCMIGCPAHVDAQGYIALAAMGDDRKAIDLIREANPFPAICGRVCVRKCEINCRRVDVDEAVAINNVKRHVSDAPGVYDGVPDRFESNGKSVGVIGGGPAGLTAGWFLGRMGYEVVVYESKEKAGGMLRYGIPEYRLTDAVLDKEIDFITRAGVKIKLNTHVGRDVTMDELRAKHDALFLGVGAQGGKPMSVPGEESTEGVLSGVKFLLDKARDKSPVKGTVVVVGGGNTAMDCARTSWRCGADKVIILYRRTKDEMPADKMEIEDCIKEGIEIMELAAPIGIVADNGKLRALQCIRMKLGEPDKSGRRRPIPMEGSEFELPCDLALAAIGQDVVLADLFATCSEKPAVTRWNTIVTDPKTMKTSVEGIFAGGDGADDGPTVVIDAIADGQKAAYSIHSYLTGMELPSEPFVVTKDFWAKPGKSELGDIRQSPRHHVHELEVDDRRLSFCEVATGFDTDSVMHEAERCLSCGCVRFDDCALRLYAEEYAVDMNKYKGYVRKHKVDARHPHIVYDPNKCVLCSRCIRTCDRVLPVSAIGLVNRGFKTEMRPAMNDPLVQTSCVSCGNCVDACPTGALTVKWPFPGRASLENDEVPTMCGFCSNGCSVVVHKINDGRYWVTASGEPGDYLCRYGRFGSELFVRSRRLTRPTRREGGKASEVSFEFGYRLAVNELRAAIGRHGADSVAVFISPECSNEEMFLANQIAREGLKTNNIGSLSLLQAATPSGVLDKSFGFTGSTATRHALDDADLIICNNTDTLNDAMVLNVSILGAVKERGAKLIVSNSTGDPMSELDNLTLDPMRGRASVLWNGVIRALLDSDRITREAVAAIPGGSDVLADLDGMTVTRASDLSGVEGDKIRQAAELVAQAKKIVIIHSPDRIQDSAPGDLTSLANLLIIARSAGIGCELLLPTISANSAAVELMGADPVFDTAKLPADAALPGAHSREELRAKLESGEIKAAIVIGEDPFCNDRTASWFRNCEFLVALDWAATETTQFADIAFPMTTYLEASGTRVSFEGVMRDFDQALEPPSGMPGWRVLSELASKLGVDVPACCSEDIGYLWLERVRRAPHGEMIYSWLLGSPTPVTEMTLRVPEVTLKPGRIPSPVTVMEKYKRTMREVGLEHFRVR